MIVSNDVSIDKDDKSSPEVSARLGIGQGSGDDNELIHSLSSQIFEPNSGTNDDMLVKDLIFLRTANDEDVYTIEVPDEKEIQSVLFLQPFVGTLKEFSMNFIQKNSKATD